MTGRKPSKSTFRSPKRKQKTRLSRPGKASHGISKNAARCQQNKKYFLEKSFSSRSPSAKSTSLAEGSNTKDVFCEITPKDDNLVFTVSNTSMENSLLIGANLSKSQYQLPTSRRPIQMQEEQSFSKSIETTRLETDELKGFANLGPPKDAEGLRVVKEMLVDLIIHACGMSSATQNPQTFQEKEKPETVNVFVNLLAKVKGKVKNRRISQTFTVTNFWQRLKYIRSKLKEIGSNIQESLKSTGDGNDFSSLNPQKSKVSEENQMKNKDKTWKIAMEDLNPKLTAGKQNLWKEKDEIEQVLKRQLEELRDKNFEMKKQLAIQQSTLAVLQNERIRHLKEKHFLNVMISKYIKQLGDVRQLEISKKDDENVEMHQKSVPQGNKGDKCSTADVLDEQIKENARSMEMHELRIPKDLEVVRDRQDREREVVKEIIADFDTLVCQRGRLLQEQAKTTMKVERLRAKNKKLHSKIIKANKFIYEKISVAIQLEHDVAGKEKEIQQLNMDLRSLSTKYAKNIGKLAAEGKRISKEKEALQNEAKNLKDNAGKLQAELNVALQKQKESDDLHQLQTKELVRLETLYGEQNVELQRTQNECNQVVSQLDELAHQNKQLEKERQTLEARAKNLERNAHDEIEQLKQELKIKAEKLAVFEQNYETTDKLYDHLSKDFETIAGENRELKNIKQELIAERENLIVDNNALKEEVKILSCKLEMIEECGKTCDLDECLKGMLQVPPEKTFKDDLVDKDCYIVLEEAHKDLAQKLLRTAHLLIDEKLGRQEIENKLRDCMLRLSEVEAEKLLLLQKSNADCDELDMCRTKMEEMSEERDRMAQVMEESKKASLDIRSQYREFEAQLNDYKEKYNSLKERYKVLISDDGLHNSELLEAKNRIEKLKKDIQCKHELVLNLQEEIVRVQQEIASSEFERRQINMKLFDMCRELELQQELSGHLELVNKRALTVTSDMKDKNILQSSGSETLLFVIHGSDNNP